MIAAYQGMVTATQALFPSQPASLPEEEGLEAARELAPGAIRVSSA